MNTIPFTQEEVALINGYQVFDRASLLIALNQALPHIDMPEMQEMAQHLICKIRYVSDEDFAALLQNENCFE